MALFTRKGAATPLTILLQDKADSKASESTLLLDEAQALTNLAVQTKADAETAKRQSEALDQALRILEAAKVDF